MANRSLLTQSALFLFGWFAIVALAPAPPPGYEIPWWSVNGGGGSSAGGTYSLTSSIGQPASGSMSGGAYSVQGGFLAFADITSAQVLNHLLGITPLTAPQLSAADANGDGVINAADLVKLISLGK